MKYEIECDFKTPVNLETLPKYDWEYSEMDCDFTASTTELIENTSTGAEFYINKSVSYGDFLVLTFLMLFLIFGITKFLIDFIIPKRMNFKR